MPKRKTTKPENIGAVIEDISTAENSLNEEMNNIFNENVTNENVEPQNDNTDLEKKRGELLKLAEDGGFDKSIAYIKKGQS